MRDHMTITVEDGDEWVDVALDVTFTPGRPARTEGPPDNWAPAERPDLQIDGLYIVRDNLAPHVSVVAWLDRHWEQMMAQARERLEEMNDGRV